ncbi:MAG: hypothetical protein ACREFO_16595 [Acetobacteraceae bacterium]
MELTLSAGLPETFAFLGCSHYCGWTRDGRLIVTHMTESKRLARKLRALRQAVSQRMQAPLSEQHRRYASILRGHDACYGMPQNWCSLDTFHREVQRLWLTRLRARPLASLWDPFC